MIRDHKVRHVNLFLSISHHVVSLAKSLHKSMISRDERTDLRIEDIFSRYYDLEHEESDNKKGTSSRFVPCE